VPAGSPDRTRYPEVRLVDVPAVSANAPEGQMLVREKGAIRWK
jgi:hypothetical protein